MWWREHHGAAWAGRAGRHFRNEKMINSHQIWPRSNSPGAYLAARHAARIEASRQVEGPWSIGRESGNHGNGHLLHLSEPALGLPCTPGAATENTLVSEVRWSSTGGVRKLMNRDVTSARVHSHHVRLSIWLVASVLFRCDGKKRLRRTGSMVRYIQKIRSPDEIRVRRGASRQSRQSHAQGSRDSDVWLHPIFSRMAAGGLTV